MLLAASKPHRSPCLKDFAARNVRALRTSSSNSSPVTPEIWPSRISCRTVRSPAAFSCANISPIKDMAVLYRKCRLAVRRHQLPQRRTHRRQVILPTPLSRARGKFGIAALYFLFEIDPHARHELQVLHHGAG